MRACARCSSRYLPNQVTPMRDSSPRRWTCRDRCVLAVVLAIATGCTGDVLTSPGHVPTIARHDVETSTDNVVLVWDAAILRAIRATHPGPPMVARALAVVHTSIFDAWSAYDARAVGTQYGGTLRRPAAERTDANKHSAISHAAYRTLVDLFPDQASAFAIEMALLGYGTADTVTMDPATAAGIGNLTSGAVIRMRHHDGIKTCVYRPLAECRATRAQLAIGHAAHGPQHGSAGSTAEF